MKSATEGYSLSLENKILQGRFRMDKRVSRGGMAWLFKGTDLEHERPIAIKILFPHFAEDKILRTRFVKESEVQCNLQHPNIVRVLSLVEEGELLGSVMEWVEGEDLKQALRRHGGPFSLKEICDLSLPVLSALGYAHANGLVHRDIKPANILLSWEKGYPIPKLIDFGIAKWLEDSDSDAMTSTGSALGTMRYMSPEQIRDSKTVDHRADIYSFGIVLYQMATGQTPFSGSTENIMFQQLYEAPQAPSELCPSISTAFEQTILRCLEKKPEDRFESCPVLSVSIRRSTPEEFQDESTDIATLFDPPSETQKSPSSDAITHTPEESSEHTEHASSALLNAAEEHISNEDSNPHYPPAMLQSSANSSVDLRATLHTEMVYGSNGTNDKNTPVARLEKRPHAATLVHVEKIDAVGSPFSPNLEPTYSSVPPIQYQDDGAKTLVEAPISEHELAHAIASLSGSFDIAQAHEILGGSSPAPITTPIQPNSNEASVLVDESIEDFELEHAASIDELERAAFGRSYAEHLRPIFLGFGLIVCITLSFFALQAFFPRKSKAKETHTSQQSSQKPMHTTQKQTCTIGQKRACYASSNRSIQGSCKAGQQTCTTKGWSACFGAIYPQKERCNGLDDDCNGKIDDTLPGVGKTCIRSVGGCRYHGRLRCGKRSKSLYCHVRSQPMLSGIRRVKIRMRPRNKVFTLKYQGLTRRFKRQTCIELQRRARRISISSIGYSLCVFPLPYRETTWYIRMQRKGDIEPTANYCIQNK